MSKSDANPKVSVLMGIYNCADFVGPAIESIIAQTYQNWELILCDDGSKDDTHAVASVYAEKYPGKIIVIQNPENRGLAYSLNHCLEKASGEYLARQDADDVSVRDRFEKQVEFLNSNPEYGWVSSAMEVINESGVVGVRKPKIARACKLDLVKGARFSHAPTMFRAEVLRAVSGYTISAYANRVEDYDLWMRLYAAGFQGFNMEEPLYRVLEDTDRFYRGKKSRLNEAKIRYHGFRAMHVPFYCYPYILKPLVLWLTPIGVVKPLIELRTKLNRKD